MKIKILLFLFFTSLQIFAQSSSELCQFKVNGEYADLYNNRGQSSLNLTNPPTNITNGFGVFTAMNADTLSLMVLK